MSYRRLRGAVLCSLAGYFLLGMLTLRRAEYDHLYPVFSWNMFSLVPNEARRYGASFEPDCSASRGDRVRVLLQNWGEALSDADEERALATRRRLESECLSQGARYELYADVASPLEAYRGAPPRRLALGAFTAGEGR